MTTVRTGVEALLPVAAIVDVLRVAGSRASGLMDTGPEAAFDDLVSLAADVTGCGRALLALADDRRAVWKSFLGMTPPVGGEEPVGENLVSLLLADGEPLVVSDAAADPRTRGHPAVISAGIGAWAGYPVVNPEGEVLGGLCVIDDRPRDWTPQQLSVLTTLARAVSSEIGLRQSLAHAQEATRIAEQATVTAEALARTLQDSLLPPVLRTVPGLEAAAAYLPAAGGATVVGDFYDLFHARGPWWCTVMGDVCGKGIEAAKVTALARYTLRAEATQHVSPATVLERLNAALLEQRGAERFLTAVYATFRTTSRGVAGRLCTAGHPPALIRRADGRIQEVGRPGTFIGILPQVELTDVRFRLGAGDTLLLYTDGATEARTRPGTPGPRPLFGEDGLAAALAECHGLDAAETVAHLSAVLARHSGSWTSDDTALLALRVPPRP